MLKGGAYRAERGAGGGGILYWMSVGVGQKLTA